MAPMSRRARTATRWLPLAAMSGSLVLSFVAFSKVWPGGVAEPVWHASTLLATLGGSPLSVSMRLDPVTAVMLLVVSIVGMCVQVYSFGYMHRDARQGWYFAVHV